MTHTVAPGDTLWSISARYHVPLATLEARNHLSDQSILQLGQAIVVGDTPSRHATVARSHHGGKPRVVAVWHASRASRPTPSVAARNAMWVVTHTGEAPAPPSAESYSLAQRIVAFDARLTQTALRYIGVPYEWGGTSFSGVDCSGFVQAVFQHNGITLPRTADSQFDVGTPVRKPNLLPGDLVFFETYAYGASHVGIYLGSGRFVHASSSYGVRVDDLSEDYYAARYIGARRLVH